MRAREKMITIPARIGYVVRPVIGWPDICIVNGERILRVGVGVNAARILRRDGSDAPNDSNRLPINGAHPGLIWSGQTGDSGGEEKEQPEMLASKAHDKLNC